MQNLPKSTKGKFKITKNLQAIQHPQSRGTKRIVARTWVKPIETPCYAEILKNLLNFIRNLFLFLKVTLFQPWSKFPYKMEGTD